MIHQVLHPFTRNPYFHAGLALRVLLILLVLPATHSSWFVPFIQNSLGGNPLDPWSTHLAAGGDPKAFPYGWAMYALLLPGVVFGTAVAWLTGYLTAAHIGLGLTVLALDLATLAILRYLRPDWPRRLYALYWLSPLVLYICYWHGQLDIVPVLLLLLSLLMIMHLQPVASGALMGAAAAAKLSMVIAPPFILIYLFTNKRLRPLLLPFIAAMGGTFLLLQAPLLLSSAGRSMVFNTPELNKVYDVAFRVSDDLHIYLLPVTYLIVLFAAWSVRRTSFDLLVALIGVGFLVTVLMTPASPGWHLWMMPFLVLIFVTTRLHMALLAGAYALLFVAFHLMHSSGASIPLLGLDLTQPLAASWHVSDHVLSMMLSLLFTGGILMVALLMREGVLRNDYFRLSRRPLMIGIAGDSGTGKDTLATSLIDIIGKESVVHISADGYHHWDRHKPMWQIMTHLNPQANDLLQYKLDVLALASGRKILNRHYDHGIGRMTKPHLVHSNDVIIGSGLHALYDPAVVERCDVRIFLDMDEGLRRYLKVRRDVHDRGHAPDRVLVAIDRRQADRERFILPQAASADLVFTLQPLHPAHVEDFSVESKLVRLKLRVSIRRGTPFEDLVRILVGVCGLHVEVVLVEHSDHTEITLEGEVDAEDVEMAAHKLVLHLDELLALHPVWQGGPAGIMQLFVLNQTAYALKKRL